MKKVTPRPRPTKQQRLRMHLRAVQRIIQPYIVMKGTYKILDSLYELNISEDDRQN